MPASTTASITVTYHVAATTAADPTVDNTASATPMTVAATTTRSVAITTHADVADLKVDSPDPVIAGNVLTYTITVTNAGPSDAQNVVVNDVLPTALTGEMYTARHGQRPEPARLAWTGSLALGTMVPGASYEIVISATVDPGTPDDTTLTNTTTRHLADRRSGPANNSDTETTHVDTSADLSVTKTDGVDQRHRR